MRSLPANRREFIEGIVSARSGRQWCLFIDRDGVINRRIVEGYVQSWDQFEFLPGVLDALATLAQWAPQMVVVTNQQGVGKGLMSGHDLSDIHSRMRTELAARDVELDDVLTCPHLAEIGCSCRKPAPGLALQWLREHSSVDPRLSVMVGDSDSDMEMAGALAAAAGGCARIRIAADGEPPGDYDAAFTSLAEFAADVQLMVEASRS
jgi:D-glycero-D-manno-heptose 1,7-bisphosphate phosphatase